MSNLKHKYKELKRLQNKIMEKDNFINDINYKIDDLPLPQEKPFLTKNGVGFVYMPYEISWYANGRIAFVLPYSQMTDYMSEDALNLVKNVNKNGKIEAYVDEQTRQKYQDYLAQPEHKICQ